MLTADDVAAALGIAPASAADRAWSESCADAANHYVNGLPHVTPHRWDPRTRQGAIMLAQRLYAARSAPLGAAGVDVTGELVRATTDPEVARMLRIGRYRPPRVG